MPTKHIDEDTWKAIEKEMVKAVVATQKPIKDTYVLKKLIEIGLKNVTEKDYKEWGK